MLEQIATWGGVAGVAVSIFAMIILFLTRKNILDILEKDVILFDKNFELKKQAIDNAFKIIDEIENFGQSVTLRPDFKEKAKACYNDLLCVVSDVRVADEFFNLAIDANSELSATRLAQFKISCRKDIGLNTKHAKIVKRTLNKNSLEETNETILKTNSISNGNNGFVGNASNYVPTPKQPEEQSNLNRVQRPTLSTNSQAQQPRPIPRPIQPSQAVPVRPTMPDRPQNGNQS